MIIKVTQVDNYNVVSVFLFAFLKLLIHKFPVVFVHSKDDHVYACEHLKHIRSVVAVIRNQVRNLR